MLRNSIIFDLETSFLSRGSKRPQSLIFEIGAVDLHARTFQSFVNPFKGSDLSLFDAITENRKQRVDSSLSFWHSLLYNKINSVGKTAAELAADIERYNDKHDVPSTSEMFKAFTVFADTCCVSHATCALIGHNSASFDCPIVDGNNGAKLFPDMYRLDSYRHLAIRFFKTHKGRKLGLGPLFRSLMPNGVDFTHHRALDDSCATLCVIHAMAVDFAAMNGSKSIYSSSCVLSFLNNFGVKKRALISSPKSRRASTVSVADKTSEKQRARFYNSIMHAATDVCKRAKAKAIEYKVTEKKKKKAVVKAAAASAVPVPTPEPERVSMCISTLKNVGDVTKKKLNALGIRTVEQLKEKRRELGAGPFLAFLKQEKVYKHKSLAGLIETLI